MKKSKILQQYKEYIILKNYRPKTITCYSGIIERFLRFCKDHSDQNLSVQEYARSYLVHRFNTGKSWSSVNMDYSAILILCKYILKVEWSYTKVPRPRTLKTLPQVLSGKQIQNMINGVKNLKHKMIITLLYSTGIRTSELINLDIADICFDRKQLHVRLGKGGKDRIVQIPETTLALMRSYLWKYNPKQHLFEGHLGVGRYSASSISKVVCKAAHRQGISQSISTHSLRHTYATHHLINGTDIVSLKKQMGHSNIKTTISYIHLCPRSVQHIKHPIEELKIILPVKRVLATSSENIQKNILNSTPPV